MNRTAVSGFLLCFAAAAPAVAQGGDPVAGKALFTTNCSFCHLASGAGGVHVGSSVSADLRAPGLETTYKNSDTLLARAILQGLDETGQPLDSPMPRWQSSLTAAQTADIIAYLKTLHS
jgi:mono/diheme cytochrome c family protein